MTTHSPTASLPDMPQVGLPESQYARMAHKAERAGDHHAHEAAKVGQYITLALDPHIRWPQKLRYFRHALHRHCTPPPLPDEAVWEFYRNMVQLVRDHCGREALRIASKEDDVYAKRISLGCDRGRIEADAEEFFRNLMGDKAARCPDYFHDEDWEALKVFRNQWI